MCVCVCVFKRPGFFSNRSRRKIFKFKTALLLLKKWIKWSLKRTCAQTLFYHSNWSFATLSTPFFKILILIILFHTSKCQVIEELWEYYSSNNYCWESCKSCFSFVCFFPYLHTYIHTSAIGSYLSKLNPFISIYSNLIISICASIHLSVSPFTSCSVYFFLSFFLLLTDTKYYHIFLQNDIFVNKSIRSTNICIKLLTMKPKDNISLSTRPLFLSLSHYSANLPMIQPCCKSLNGYLGTGVKIFFLFILLL